MRLKPCTIPHVSTPSIVQFREVRAIHPLQVSSGQFPTKRLVQDQCYPENPKEKEEYQFIGVPILSFPVSTRKHVTAKR